MLFAISGEKAVLEQSELVQALTPVVRFFVNQQIDYFIGGSVASSHHGASRSTLDVDLTVVFRDIHIKPLIAVEIEQNGKCTH